MDDAAWILAEPLRVLKSQDDPYLMTAQGTLGAHDLVLHYAPDTGAGAEFRVFLDGGEVFDLGRETPAEPWFRLCRDLGYDPEGHWDLDPALILFRQVVPELAREWREQPLPYGPLGVPEGVVCLASVQEAWNRAVERLPAQKEGERLVAACLRGLPLRAVAFHDHAGHREDFVGTGVDDPLLGVYVHLGRSPAERVILSKATLNGTGGLRWSPWQAGGEWREEGRARTGTLGPEAFLQAAGLGETPPPGFREAFGLALTALIGDLDEAVEACRRAFPAPILWHRDPSTRYLNHMIVALRVHGGRTRLVLDDGSEVPLA